MWKNKKEKPEEQGGKGKLFKNPIKPIETTLIGASVRLEGSIEAEGTLIIEGFARGIIKCSSLEIMENGKVEAEVEDENITVAGDFEGEIICSGKLSVLRTGKVQGRISYGALSIKPGGRLSGALSKFNAKDTAILPFYKEGDQSE